MNVLPRDLHVNKPPHLALGEAVQRSSLGLVIELGVWKGTSLREIAEAVPERTVYGFDSFEGLPEPWRGDAAGHFSTNGNPPENLPANCQIVKGLVQNTLEPFLKEKQEHVAFVNFDMDIYSATSAALKALAPWFYSGSILHFDQIMGHRGNLDEEYQAFAEFLKWSHYRFTLIGQRHAESLCVVLHR